MVKNYSDSYVGSKSISFEFLTVVGLFLCLYIEYVSIFALFKSFEKIQLFNKYFAVFFMAIFVFIIVGGYILSGIFQLIDGKKLIWKLSIADKVFIKNSMLDELSIDFKNIASINDGQKKMWLKNSKLYLKDGMCGLTINLKDGRFFRVSPHMERIDELKGELERIIEENKSE